MLERSLELSSQELLQANSELRLEGERLLNAERLAAIGETAAMVGHDLRNPLQGISAATYALKTKFRSLTFEQARELVEIIEKSLEYADGIINDLLDYSKEMRVELHETTPRTIAKDSLMRIKIPRNIAILDLTRDGPILNVDAANIRRVFINLIENAIEAMREGGEITISSTESNNNIELSFTDTGPGISEEIMEKLWQPLMTTKPKGLGLGLAICKRIAEAHDGSISVKSTLGHGTTFTLTLPIKPSTGLKQA